MLSLMRQLFSILKDSFIIWSRNFTLIYVIFLAQVTISLLVPQGGEPTMELRWFLLLAIMMLLMSAFLAGWFSMIAQACANHLEPSGSKPQPPATPNPLEAFSLLKAFLPGIGRHFLPVIGSCLIQGGVLFLLYWSIHPIWVQSGPLLNKLYSHGASTQARFYSLPPTEQALLGKLSFALIGVTLAYLAFSVLTMLWPAFVTLYNDNVIKAYLQSVLRFFKDPFRFLFLSGLLIGLQALFLFLAFNSFPLNPNLPLAAIFFQLLGLLSGIYMMIALFVYVYRTEGRPLRVVEEAEEPETEPSDNEPPGF